MSELLELNDRIRDALLLSIEAALEDDDLKMPDGWLELAEFWEACIKDAHYAARARGFAY